MLRVQTTLRAFQACGGSHSTYSRAGRELDHGRELTLALSSQSGQRLETRERCHSLSLRGKEGLSCKPRVSLGGRTPGPGHCVTTVTVGPCGCRPAAVVGFLSAGAFPLEAWEARGVNWSRSSYSLGGKGGKNPATHPSLGG